MSNSENEASLNAEPSLRVLTGISRRFETDSRELASILFQLNSVASAASAILIIGESGTGKSYLARLVHEISLRRYEPFLTVSCEALPSDQIEGELFGERRVATQNHQKAPDSRDTGKVIAARRGTVLLEEIDSLGLDQQSKLLRVIQTGQFESAGSRETQICHASFILTSQPAIQSLVVHQRFRKDLYERLNPWKFVIPPLRHRKMDIVPLARKFIRQLSMKHGIAIQCVDPDVFSALMEFPWPGNVRELVHVVEQAIISSSNGRLQLGNLPRHILSGRAITTLQSLVQSSSDQCSSLDANGKANSHLSSQIAWNEKELIEQALFNHQFSRIRTADQLGISRVTLYNKMKKYGLQQ
jgi:DNA-binding NtrC family response regulator